MTSGKHPKTGKPSDADLKGNPGIGQSKGTTMTGSRPGRIAGDNTVEGDVGNDATPAGGVDPNRTGRSNK